MTPDRDTDAASRAEAVRDAVDDETETDEERIPDIPEDAVREAERLTRLARATAQREAGGQEDAPERPAEAPSEADIYRERREALVADHEYESRIREEDDTLVLYPEEWLEDGVVQFDRIEETDRGVEVSLSGAGDPEQWRDVADHNDALVDAVAEEYGEAHAANARAFATFMNNHYAKEIERATADEVTEFLDEYYPRNSWPSEMEASLVEESVKKLFSVADTERTVVSSRS
ncbi:MAG: hypothetical protein V5A38_05955 [Halolamina sp.]|uniref:DUF7108 family protein n=1 Tax=Halolamina sp. TaxID=1940283 RepID=UPI002FC36DC5